MLELAKVLKFIIFSTLKIVIFSSYKIIIFSMLDTRILFQVLKSSPLEHALADLAH